MYANLGSQIGHRRCEAHPHNILYIDIIAKEPLFILVNINNTDQPVAVLSEVVKERRILTHGRVGVGRIITG